MSDKKTINDISKENNVSINLVKLFLHPSSQSKPNPPHTSRDKATNDNLSEIDKKTIKRDNTINDNLSINTVEQLKPKQPLFSQDNTADNGNNNKLSEIDKNPLSFLDTYTSTDDTNLSGEDSTSGNNEQSDDSL